MKYFTPKELIDLNRLARKLRLATPHSPQAVRIGRRIAAIYRAAHIRNNPPNPAIDKAMNQLSKRLGIT